MLLSIAIYFLHQLSSLGYIFFFIFIHSVSKCLLCTTFSRHLTLEMSVRQLVIFTERYIFNANEAISAKIDLAYKISDLRAIYLYFPHIYYAIWMLCLAFYACDKQPKTAEDLRVRKAEWICVCMCEHIFHVSEYVGTQHRWNCLCTSQSRTVIIDTIVLCSDIYIYRQFFVLNVTQQDAIQNHIPCTHAMCAINPVEISYVRYVAECGRKRTSEKVMLTRKSSP